MLQGDVGIGATRAEMLHFVNKYIFELYMYIVMDSVNIIACYFLSGSMFY